MTSSVASLPPISEPKDIIEPVSKTAEVKREVSKEKTKKPFQQQSEEDGTKKIEKKIITEVKKTNPEPVIIDKEKVQIKEEIKKREIVWDDDIDLGFDPLGQSELSQTVTTNKEPKLDYVPPTLSPSPAEEVKASVQEPITESAPLKHTESQSAQYDEFLDNAFNNSPENKDEIKSMPPIVTPTSMAQTGISISQKAEPIPDFFEEEKKEESPNFIPDDIDQEKNSEKQTERGGDYAEDNKYPTIEKKIIPEVTQVPIDKPPSHTTVDQPQCDLDLQYMSSDRQFASDTQNLSPIGALLIDMERKLGEEQKRVFELENENKQCILLFY